MATICRGTLTRIKNAYTIKTASCLSGLLHQNSTIIHAKRHNTVDHQYAVDSTTSRRKAEYLRELYYRRLEVGPEKERHPSVYGCWSQESEVYAFGQRLGENFDEKLLRQAFAQRSYVEAEIAKQKDLGLDIEVDMEDNSELSKKGRLFASRIIKAYLRYSFPEMFEEGICAIHDYLMSDEVLLNVGKSLGFRELMQTAEYPPEDHNYITTLQAVIGALSESQAHRADMFVLDFIIPQLVGKDVNELWNVPNPMGLLVAMLKDSGRGEPESRLLWSSAKNTLMPLYHVGIYSDKQLIGKSPGETAIIAEEMAARDALKSLMKTGDSRAPFVLGDRARDLELNYYRVNRSAFEILRS